MPIQEFETADVLRLEIERDPTGVELLNLVANPDGAGGETYGTGRRIGGWGWLTSITNSNVDAAQVGGTSYLRVTLVGSADNYVDTERTLLTPSSAAYVTATWAQSNAANVYTSGQFRFFNAAGSLISEGQRGPAKGTGTVGSAPITAVPAGTVYVALRVWLGIGVAMDTPGSVPTTDLTAVTVIATAAQPSLSNVTRTNLCANPSAEVNVTGWTASNGTILRSTNVPRIGQGRFQLTTTSTTATLENSRACTAGLTYTVSAYIVRGVGGPGGTGRMFIRWKNASNVAIGATVFGANANLDTTFLNRAVLTATAPAGAVTMEYGVQYNLTATGQVIADAFLVEQAAAINTYIEGTVVHPTAAWPATPSVYWRNVTNDLTGPIKITRQSGDIGTLSAALTDATLDPATGSPALKPGRQVRCSALANGAWTSLFRGKLRPSRTVYELEEADPRTRLTINAVDAWAALGGKKITNVLGLIAWLPAKFEGLGLPWAVSSTGTGHAGAPTAGLPALDGFVLDNVIIARDLDNGYAWTNAYGVVNVWTRADWSAVDPATVAITEDDYNGDFSASYDPTDLINSVKVTVLDTATSTDYGPYEDTASIQRLGGEVFPATFTVAPPDPATFDEAAYAAAVLASNSTPEVVVDTLTIPLHTQARVNKWAPVDLEHLAHITNADLGYSADNRVASVTHVIDPGHNITEAAWLMTLTFHRPDRAPIPTK